MSRAVMAALVDQDRAALALTLFLAIHPFHGWEP